MTVRRWLALLFATSVGACASRTELPKPVLPFTRTPDAAFRAVPPEPAAELQSEPLRVATHTLANGLTVNVVERPGLPLFTAALVVRGAGRESPAEPSGLASLTGRMLVHGTRLADGREVRMPHVLGQGLRISSDEALGIAIDAPAPGLPAAIELLARVAREPVFAESEFSRAVTAHLDALAGATQDRMLIDTAIEQLYGPTHPLARSMLGRSEVVSRLPVSAVRAFHATRYGPNVSALLVAGDVTSGAVFQLAERHLATWQSEVPPPAPLPSAIIAPRDSRPIVALAASPSLPHVTIAVAGPGVSHDDHLPFTLATTALSGLALSRGNQALSHHDVVSYGVSSERRARLQSSEVFLHFAVETPDLASSIRTILELIEALKTERLDPSELARVREHSLVLLEERLASNAGVVATLANLFGSDELPASLETLRAELRGVAATAVQRAAAAWFRRERIQIVVVADPATAASELASIGAVHWFDVETKVTKY